MPVAQTSKAAFKKVKLGPEQLSVYNALKQLKEATDLEIADYLGKPINTVVGRRNELVRYGYVREEGRRFNRTGNTAKSWVTVNPNFERILRMIKGETDTFREVADCN